jgi:hypothetical protein
LRRACGLIVLDANDTDAGPLVFSGEVWTDARGYATVALPHTVGLLHGGLAYELQPFTAGVTARIAAELSDGRFTIATDEPHVKVVWRVSGRRSPETQKPVIRDEGGTS